MAQVELKILSREEVGKSAARKMREKGLIPAVIYGKGKKASIASVDPSQLKKALLKGGGINALLNLTEEGTKSAKKTVIVKDLQKDPVTFAYCHVDFYELDLKKTVTVKVPLHFVGKAEGIAQGGIVQPVLREVDIKCLPHHIPSNIDVDVSPLKIGDSFHLSDLKNLLQGKDFEIFYTNDDTVVTVSVAKEEVQAPAAATSAEGAPATEASAAPTAGTESTPVKGQPAKGQAPSAPDEGKKDAKKKDEGKNK